MRALGLVVLLLGVLLRGSEAQADSDSNCVSDLKQQIEAILETPEYRTATWGIEIVGYQGGEREELFSLLKDNFRVPASNTKLLTTSALFTVVNVEKEHFETPIFFSSDNGGSHLCIKGSGDPSLSYSQMQGVAKVLSTEGFRQVNRLTLDSSLFFSPYAEGQPFSESWQWSDITAAYGAHPNSAMVKENAFYVTVTSTSAGNAPDVNFSVPSSVIPLHNTAVTVDSSDPLTLQIHWKLGSPILVIEGNIPVGRTLTYHLAAIDSNSFYISLFKEALEGEGVGVGSVLFGECNSSSVPLVSLLPSSSSSEIVGLMRSRKWSELFNHTLQESDNLYAEAWIRALGRIFAPTSTEPSLQQGLEAVSSVLSRNLGVSESCHRQIDGCGLSVKNLVTPDCLIQVLKGVADLPNGQEYFDFLPLAGESGTLAHRFVGTSAQGRVRAKTGTITGTNALSGIVDNPNYDTLLFSILVNESNQFASVIRGGIDSIVELLPNLDPRC